MNIKQLLSIINITNLTIRDFDLSIYGPQSKILIALKEDVMIQAVYDQNEQVHQILAVHGPEKLFWHDPQTYAAYLDHFYNNNLTSYTIDELSEGEILQQCHNVWNFKCFKDAIQLNIQLPFHILEFYRTAAMQTRMSVEDYLAHFLINFADEETTLDIPIKVLTNTTKND